MDSLFFFSIKLEISIFFRNFLKKTHFFEMLRQRLKYDGSGHAIVSSTWKHSYKCFYIMHTKIISDFLSIIEGNIVNSIKFSNVVIFFAGHSLASLTIVFVFFCFTPLSSAEFACESCMLNFFSCRYLPRTSGYYWTTDGLFLLCASSLSVFSSHLCSIPF